MPIAFPLRQFRSSVFVETGTEHGHGVWLALATGFKKVYSIEISPQYYEKAKDRFRAEIDEGRVVLLLGDSREQLSRILHAEARDITFWLDAHSQPHNLEAQAEGAEVAVHCPLYEEIDAIGAHRLKSHTIMIDDVRLLGHNDAWGGHNVTLEGVRERIIRINESYKIIFQNGFQPNDVLVAYTRRSAMLYWAEKAENVARHAYKKIKPAHA